MYLRIFMETTIEEITLNTANIRTVNDKDFMVDFGELLCWNIPTHYDPYNTVDRQINILDLIRGAIPYSLFWFFKSHLNPSLKSSDINFFVSKTISKLSVCLR